MNTSINKDDFPEDTNLSQPELSYGLLTELVGVKNRTLRTWLNRYFPGVGTRQENGKMLFSWLECVCLQVFADLVSKLTVQPETAVIVANAGYIHLREMASSEKFGATANIFLIIRNANKVQFDFDLVSDTEAGELFRINDSAPFIVVPFSLRSMRVYDRLRALK